MKNINSIKTKILFALISVAAITSAAYAQGGMASQTPSRPKAR